MYHRSSETQRIGMLTTSTLSIPLGTGQNTLVVLDWINMTQQQPSATPAAGVVSLSVTPNTGTTTLWAQRIQIAATADLTTNISSDFSGGFPLWNAVDSDTVVGTGPQVIATGPTGFTNLRLSVGYHYENPSNRRS